MNTLQKNCWVPPHVKTPKQLEPTSKDILGPFYRPNPPEGNELCGPDQPGEKLTLSGHVLNQQGEPIAGAKVDVWQADREGNYDIADPKDAQNPAFPYAFRRYQNTNAEGEFGFSTIRPGHYSIGDNQWRTGHIHVKVDAPGYQPLTTQLYFEGDQHNDADHWFDASRVVKEHVCAETGWAHATYDIVLPRVAGE